MKTSLWILFLSFRKRCQFTLSHLQMYSGLVFIGQSNHFYRKIPACLWWTSQRPCQIPGLCYTLGPYHVHIGLLLRHHFSPVSVHSSSENENWVSTLWRKPLGPQSFNVFDCCIISLDFKRYNCLLLSLVYMDLEWDMGQLLGPARSFIHNGDCFIGYLCQFETLEFVACLVSLDFMKMIRF